MITKEQSNFIKLVAIATMLLDHIGKYLFPFEILRIIGRISFPLFAYQLGVGYKMTSSKEGYIKRLLIFGIISQVPYSLLRGDFLLNILFSLALGVFSIWALENKKFFYFFLIIPFSFLVSYGIYGLAVILFFYFLKNKIYQAFSFFSVTFLYALFYGWGIQLFALFALPIIFKPFSKANLPRNFFYLFYPLHLAVIYLLKISIDYSLVYDIL